MGPPPGQEGPPAPPPPVPPSDFNTPLVTPHPVDVQGEAAPAVTTITSPRPSGRLAALLVFAIVVAIVGAFLASSIGGNSPSAISPPRRPRAKAAACGPPRCDRLRTTVTLTWSGGSDVSSYTIDRNGTPLSTPSLDATSTTFTDDTAVLGATYDYVVVAHGSNGAVASSPPVHVKVPVPPVAAAQLDGTYRVQLTVTKASNFSRLEGIVKPRPGDRRKTTWNFLASCGAPQGACPTTWDTVGTIRPSGRTYSGSFTGGHADCHPGSVPVHFSMRLTVHHAQAAGGSWLVSAIEGTYSVTFTCRGGPSIGELRVVGRAA